MNESCAISHVKLFTINSEMYKWLVSKFRQQNSLIFFIDLQIAFDNALNHQIILRMVIIDWRKIKTFYVFWNHIFLIKAKRAIYRDIIIRKVIKCGLSQGSILRTWSFCYTSTIRMISLDFSRQRIYLGKARRWEFS